MLTRLAAACLLSMICLGVAPAFTAEEQPSKPGLTPYTPTKIEWLTVVVNSLVQRDASSDYPYTLGVATADHETLVIVVRYLSSANRAVMNRDIEVLVN